MDLPLNKELIIFDLDGTLIDSSADIVFSANRTLERMGYPLPGDDVVKAAIGWGVGMLLKQLLSGESEERIKEATSVFMGVYVEHLVVETRPYPGVMDTLARFKGLGKEMAVVTNKPIGLTRIILEELSLKGFFAHALGGDSLSEKKPHPAPILKVLALAVKSPEEAVMVGDSSVDIESAVGAGIETIGAAYGFRGVEELKASGADIIIDGFDELKDLIV